MSTKPPFAGDQYRSKLYLGQRCKVIRIIEGQITFQWLGDYAHIDQQTTALAQFLLDFEFLKAAPNG